MHTITTFPTLYKKTSTGAIQEWQIFVEDATIVTIYGQVDGKKQESRDTIKEGKNIGRSNETTASQQAELEAKSQWEKKVKKGYVQSIDDAQNDKVDATFITGGINPMLAHNFSEHSHKIVYPAAVQPKLDGHRCIAIVKDGKATLWSRTRKPILGVPHIIEALNSLRLPDIIFDGELYNHDYRDKFEELTSFIKRPEPKPGHEVVQYHVYDIVSDLVFGARWGWISAYLNSQGGYGKRPACLVPVETRSVANGEELMEAFAKHCSLGYEGTIVRNKLSKYVNKRSYDLLKVKEFQDAEFPIVDVEEGRGKMAGKAVFICQTPEGETFKCKMVGSLESLTEYLENKDKYIGRDLTVQFQNYSATGVPRFAVGLRFREDV